MKLKYILELVYAEPQNRTYEWMLDSLGKFSQFEGIYNANIHAFKPIIFLRELLTR